MKEKIDYVKKYDLETTLKSTQMISHDVDKKTLLRKAMRLKLKSNNYSVRSIGGFFGTLLHNVYLGRYGVDSVPLPTDSLVLETNFPESIFGKRRRPIVGLSYGLAKYDSCPDFFITINYVQTTRETSLEKFLKDKNLLGSHPHEFLLSHFIARARNFLDCYPSTMMSLNCPDVALYVTTNGSVIARSTSADRLYDRFFDNEGHLNPNKERVRQILGPENAWIKYRTQTK